MEAVFEWLFQQQSLGWVLFFAAVIGVAVMVAFGLLITKPQMDRERARDKETIERQSAALIVKDEALTALSESVKELLRLGHATNRAVKEALERRRR